MHGQQKAGLKRINRGQGNCKALRGSWVDQEPQVRVVGGEHGTFRQDIDSPRRGTRRCQRSGWKEEQTSGVVNAQRRLGIPMHGRPGSGAPRFGPHFGDHDQRPPAAHAPGCAGCTSWAGRRRGYVTSSAKAPRGGRPERARRSATPDPRGELVGRLRRGRRRLTGPRLRGGGGGKAVTCSVLLSQLPQPRT